LVIFGEKLNYGKQRARYNAVLVAQLREVILQPTPFPDPGDEY
jgi:hypothetical protein